VGNECRYRYTVDDFANPMMTGHQVVHFDNGVFGVGSYPTEDDIDPELINAGNELITVVADGSCFDSAQSFGMISGVAVLGAMQVSQPATSRTG